MEVRKEVVDSLGKYASPVDRVDSSKAVCFIELMIREKGLDNILYEFVSAKEVDFNVIFGWYRLWHIPGNRRRYPLQQGCEHLHLSQWSSEPLGWGRLSLLDVR